MGHLAYGVPCDAEIGDASCLCVGEEAGVRHHAGWSGFISKSNPGCKADWYRRARTGEASSCRSSSASPPHVEMGRTEDWTYFGFHHWSDLAIRDFHSLRPLGRAPFSGTRVGTHRTVRAPGWI